MPLELKPLHPLFGAAVEGIDLRALDDDLFAELRAAYDRHGLLLIAGQELSPGDQAALGRRFGLPSVPPRREFNIPEHPEISILGNLTRPDGRPAAFFNEMGEEWHSDSAGYENLDGVTFLYALEVPPRGGETMFCSMHAAWESLPPERQREMRGRRLLHSWNHHNDKVLKVSKATPLPPEQRALYPDRWTDLVQEHPVTGRPLYYLSHNLVKQVDDMDEAASLDYVMELVAHATTEDKVYRHAWKPGDLLLWDNRALMHSATNVEVYRDAVRHLHRSYSFTGPRARAGGALG